jgi:hypothetical protein
MTILGKRTPPEVRPEEGTMNEKLTYRLLIHGSSINGDAFSCTGEQAKQLISDLVPWTKSCRWFFNLLSP